MLQSCYKVKNISLQLFFPFYPNIICILYFDVNKSKFTSNKGLILSIVNVLNQMYISYFKISNYYILIFYEYFFIIQKDLSSEIIGGSIHWTASQGEWKPKDGLVKLKLNNIFLKDKIKVNSFKIIVKYLTHKRSNVSKLV